jgi:hypothetical protein
MAAARGDPPHHLASLKPDFIDGRLCRSPATSDLNHAYSNLLNKG